jgi:hypothetical protein
LPKVAWLKNIQRSSYGQGGGGFVNLSRGSESVGRNTLEKKLFYINFMANKRMTSKVFRVLVFYVCIIIFSILHELNHS